MQTNDYGEKSGNIRQLAAMSPDQFIDHLTTIHPHISTAAPNIAPHVFSAATNAVQFLNSKLPHAGNELPQDQIPEPSIAQKKAWLDLHGLVNNPTSVLDHVNNGTLNSHHMEAMRSVYPDLHQEMAQKISEELGARHLSGEQIPYQKRISISKFIGQPVDSTLTKPNLMAIINSANQNTAQSQAGAPKKASNVELKQINKVNSLYQTPSQARAVDKRT